MNRHPSVRPVRGAARLLAAIGGLVLITSAVFLSAQPRQPAAEAVPPADPQPRWWKGNLHTHSLWSDGDQYPELIAEWYKQHGYHFLALSDHNVLSAGSRWIDIEKNKGGRAAFEQYRKRFGSWVETREADKQGGAQVRLKPYNEFRSLYEEPDRFLMLQSEEISDAHQRKPIHINVTNIRDLIPPQRGDSVEATIRNNLRAVHEQRQKTGQAMFAHLNHPNFGWGVRPEDLARVTEERFFEVYNGHRGVRNAGDDQHVSVERLWDICLVMRITQLGGAPLYGLATDDAHEYHAANKTSIPGRGWVMVRAARLTPEAIVDAMERGDFYASTGVVLADVERTPTILRVRMEPQRQVTYRTEFIGTLRDYQDGNDIPDASNPRVGKVLKTVEGLRAEYKLTGRELYVRAKITSSQPKADPYEAGEREMAWTQPAVPANDKESKD